MTSVEELVLEFEGRAKDADRVGIWVPDRLVLAGQEVAMDVGMAVLLDRVLALEFEPDGFTEAPGGRTYHYKKWKQ
jgi:hypothetical protein